MYLISYLNFSTAKVGSGVGFCCAPQNGQKPVLGGISLPQSEQTGINDHVSKIEGHAGIKRD